MNILRHLAIAVAITATLPLATGADNVATTPSLREHGKYPEWLANNYKRIDADLNGKVDLKKVDVILVGDSITNGWQGQGPLWKSTFSGDGSPYCGLNLGVGGDRTEHVLFRLMSKDKGGMGQVDSQALKPKVVMLTIGTNNLFSPPETPQETAEGALAGVKAISARFPTAKIILCSVPPTGAAKDAARAEKVPRINAILAKEVSAMKDGRVTFLDVYAKLVGADGKQDPQFFNPDTVHLNAKGYEVWHKELMPVLGRLIPPGT